MPREIIPQDQRVKTVSALIEENKAGLAAALPHVPGMEAERWIRILMTAIRKNPDLGNCTPMSLMGCLMDAAASGLPVGVAGGLYLIPYKNECTIQYDYRAYITLARRSGLIDSIWAEVVRQKDDFHVVFGPERSMRHVPYKGADGGELVAVYCCWTWVKSGRTDWVVLWDWQVEERRAMSRRRSGDDAPWEKWQQAMWMKTAVRYASDFWPLEPEERAAILAEDSDRPTVVEMKPAQTLDSLTDQLRENAAKDPKPPSNGAPKGAAIDAKAPPKGDQPPAGAKPDQKADPKPDAKQGPPAAKEKAAAPPPSKPAAKPPSKAEEKPAPAQPPPNEPTELGPDAEPSTPEPTQVPADDAGNPYGL